MEAKNLTERFKKAFKVDEKLSKKEIESAMKELEKGKAKSQIAQSLSTYKDRGEFDGSLKSAIKVLKQAQYEIDEATTFKDAIAFFGDVYKKTDDGQKAMQGAISVAVSSGMDPDDAFTELASIKKISDVPNGWDAKKVKSFIAKKFESVSKPKVVDTTVAKNLTERLKKFSKEEK